jgi:sterol-4alpha-carboxylate 3-dehydrogenase (decarboxylating)
MAHQETYLVMGGSGFLGRKIVEALIRRGEKNVSTFDIAQRYHDVPHYSGDITDGVQLGEILSKVIASPGRELRLADAVRF